MALHYKWRIWKPSMLCSLVKIMQVVSGRPGWRSTPNVHPYECPFRKWFWLFCFLKQKFSLSETTKGYQRQPCLTVPGVRKDMVEGCLLLFLTQSLHFFVKGRKHDLMGKGMGSEVRQAQKWSLLLPSPWMELYSSIYRKALMVNRISSGIRHLKHKSGPSLTM